MELIKDRTGAFIVHIPYRGAAPAVQDVLGNQLPVMVIDTAVGLPHIRAGKLVPLGVLSRQRLPRCPMCQRSKSRAFVIPRCTRGKEWWCPPRRRVKSRRS